MFRLSLGDFGRGLLMAILAPVFVSLTAVLGAIINAPSFDVFAVDWVVLGHNLTNVLIVTSYGAGVSYIIKNFLTSTQGNFLTVGDK